jgi:hypothetical protein
MCGSGTGGYNHEFPKNGSGIFLPQGLDTSGKSVIRVFAPALLIFSADMHGKVHSSLARERGERVPANTSEVNRAPHACVRSGIKGIVYRVTQLSCQDWRRWQTVRILLAHDARRSQRAWHRLCFEII